MAGLNGSKHWEVLSQDQKSQQKLTQELKLPSLVTRTLVARGYTTPEAAKRFLTPSLERDWEDPALIPGLEEVADLVEQALKNNEHIAIFGDFDVDGMSATCLLTLGLRALGAEVYPFIPNRFGEGYGLSHEALQRLMKATTPDLIITVDNGIAAAQKVEALKAEGIDVAITDHHEPGDEVPNGVPVADPKLSEGCPSRDLAGAGVALKLVQMLGERAGKPELWRHYTMLATLGTISDMMDLSPENRALVADGIKRLPETDRPGIVALAEQCKVPLTELTADNLPFTLIPRLNAAGRMGAPDTAFQLLLTDDPAEATKLAEQIEQINQDRRQIEAQLTDEALEKVKETYHGERIIVVGGEGWHEGVKGIVASRLTARYHVPTILFTIQDGVALGSGRSVGSVDLFHAVEQCADMLIRFGGHAGAVGVTLDASRFDEFRSRMQKIMDALPEDQFEDKGEITAVIRLSEANQAGIEALEMLQPFGMGNKRPLFAARGVTMKARARVGNNGDHLRFVATDGTNSIPAIMFHAPHVEELACYEGAVDLVFDAINETWQGRTKPKLMVKDIVVRIPKAPVGLTEAQQKLQGIQKHAGMILVRPTVAVSGAETFVTKLYTRNTQAASVALDSGELLQVVDNHSKKLEVVTDDGQVAGHLHESITSMLVSRMHKGAQFQAQVKGISHDEKKTVRVQIAPRVRTQAVDIRKQLEALSEEKLTQALVHTAIGDNELLPAQKQALEMLSRGQSALCVIATGRGKSLIFTVHAARLALKQHRASVFVYPLRALVNDQFYHLDEELGKLGIGIAVLSGATPTKQRRHIFEQLQAGSLDIILTTPEFLALHSKGFCRSHRIGFVVVDEAHHMQEAKSGQRSAYGDFPKILTSFGHPTCLATTATAPDPVAKEIAKLLSLERKQILIDKTARTNLTIQDLRETREKKAALVNIVASGQKSVVYVNSRDQTVQLVRYLRHAISDLAGQIAYYNAGLLRGERTQVEQAFRKGDLTCIVATSAFGEGVNIPDIRHVVLYHLPFSEVEFNQMCGRAGRDGKPAEIDLLFSTRDARLNDQIIAAETPERSDLVDLYKVLLGQWRATGGEPIEASDEELLYQVRLINQKTRLTSQGIAAGLGIFQEFGFLDVRGFVENRHILMTEAPRHTDLSCSVRLQEGMRAREDFVSFRDRILTAPAQELLYKLCRPIVPHMGCVVDG